MSERSYSRDSIKFRALSVTPAETGPLLLNGEFTLHSADGETRHKSDKTALCRCGASGNTPFCDGTHRHVGFSTA